MEAHSDEIGPVDIVVISKPARLAHDGRGHAPWLLDLVERRIIRVLDVLFVMEGEDGTFAGFKAERPRRRGDRRVQGLRGRVDRPARRRRRHDRRRGARARKRRRPDRVREQLGGPVRGRRAAQRRGRRRQPADPARDVMAAIEAIEASTPEEKGAANARIATRDGAHRRRRGHRDHGVQPREPPPGEPLGEARTRAHPPTWRAPSRRRSSTRRRRLRRAPSGDDRLTQLKELGALKEQGVLTDEEFAAREGPHPGPVSTPSSARRRTPQYPVPVLTLLRSPSCSRPSFQRLASLGDVVTERARQLWPSVCLTSARMILSGRRSAGACTRAPSSRARPPAARRRRTRRSLLPRELEATSGSCSSSRRSTGIGRLAICRQRPAFAASTPSDR